MPAQGRCHPPCPAPRHLLTPLRHLGSCLCACMSHFGIMEQDVWEGSRSNTQPGGALRGPNRLSLLLVWAAFRAACFRICDAVMDAGGLPAALGAGGGMPSMLRMSKDQTLGYGI